MVVIGSSSKGGRVGKPKERVEIAEVIASCLSVELAWVVGGGWWMVIDRMMEEVQSNRRL